MELDPRESKGLSHTLEYRIIGGLEQMGGLENSHKFSRGRAGILVAIGNN